MDPAERTDIEMAMQGGVAVVSYDCKRLTLIKTCSVQGKYGFLGRAPQQEVIRMRSQDEVDALIPISGSLLARRFAAGETLELTLITAGERRTTWERVVRTDLSGVCAGATHVIQGALVGAFEMTSVVSSGNGSRTTQQKDGDLRACATVRADAREPHPECRAITQLVLLPVTP